MSSSYMPLWKRPMTKTPLMKKCGGYNYHWRWERVCVCEGNGVDLRDMKTGYAYRLRVIL